MGNSSTSHHHRTIEEIPLNEIEWAVIELKWTPSLVHVFATYFQTHCGGTIMKWKSFKLIYIFN